MKSNVAQFTLALLMSSTLASAAPARRSAEPSQAGGSNVLFRRLAPPAHATAAVEDAVEGVENVEGVVKTVNRMQHDASVAGLHVFDPQTHSVHPGVLLPYWGTNARPQHTQAEIDEMIRLALKKQAQHDVHDPPASPNSPKEKNEAEPSKGHKEAEPSKEKEPEEKSLEEKKPSITRYQKIMAFFAVNSAVVGLGLNLTNLINNHVNLKNTKKVASNHSGPPPAAAGPK